MDVRFEEAVFQADQDVQEGQLIGEGGDGELDGGVKKRVGVFEEHIQILWGSGPQEENVDETFPCVLADGDQAAGQELSLQPAHEDRWLMEPWVSPWQCRRSAGSSRLQS